MPRHTMKIMAVVITMTHCRLMLSHTVEGKVLLKRPEKPSGCTELIHVSFLKANALDTCSIPTKCPPWLHTRGQCATRQPLLLQRCLPEKHMEWQILGLIPAFLFHRSIKRNGCGHKEQRTKLSPCTALEKTQNDSFPQNSPWRFWFLTTVGRDHWDKGLKTTTETIATIYYWVIKWNKQIWSISFIFQFLFWTE